MTRRLGRALAVTAVAWLAAGCAALQGAAPSAQQEGPAAGATPAAPAAVEVEIDAPEDLKPLLERHLDLARFGALSRGETVTDTELARLVAAAPAQARELLQTEGYFEPQVTARRIGSAPERVQIHVDPGPRTTVAEAAVDVEGALADAVAAKDPLALETLAALRAAWPLKRGAPFRNPDWSDAKAGTLARLRGAGYAAATWAATQADVDVAARRARLSVRAASGPLFRSGEIEIEGLQRQDRETVLNLANFKRGTRVTETLLLDFQDRLQKSGLFEGVSVTLDADPAHAVAAPVRVKLTEAALHQVIAGFGVSATTGPRATLEHVWRRVFDRAITARNKLEWGRDRQAWDGEASTHPDDDLYRWVLGVTIERLKSDSDVVLSQSVRAGRAQDTPRIDRFHFAEFVRASRRTGTTRTDASALSLNVHWTWRDIDSPILPTDGVTLSLQGGLGQARGDAGTHSGFGRAWGRITFYKPLGRQWYGQARFEAGQVFVRTGLDVPETLRFRAGGDESVRGYAYRSLGPLVEGEVGSGDVVATASVELARPVSAALPSVWGAVFVDAGNAADSFGHLNPVLGTGVGVRWRSPVGPLKLDWAYGREVHRSRLHFSVGIVF